MVLYPLSIQTELTNANKLKNSKIRVALLGVLAWGNHLLTLEL